MIGAGRGGGMLGSPRSPALAASPRAALALDKCGRAHAWLNGRGYVDPLDIRAIAPDVFRHRLTQSYEAQGEGIAADQVIAALLDRVVLRIARKNALVLVFSDFDTLDAETEPLNAALARANDLILFNIADPLSERLPEGFRAMVSDGDLQAELDGRRAERTRHGRAAGGRGCAGHCGL